MKEVQGIISVIIPAYNEAKRIALNLEEAIKTFDDFGCKYEIVVMDDGSKDKTYEEALKIAERYPTVTVKKNQRNFGKGRALKKGMWFD